MTRIRRVAVVGAGTMGSQLAALCSGLGLGVTLFDVVPPGAADRHALVRQALARLRQLRPAPFYRPEDLERIRPANLEDDLALLGEADWVLEAVVERLDVKRQVWQALAPHVRHDAVLSTNTSGLGIAAIAAALPAHLRPRFLGTHFFNPPRYLRLLEVVPGPETDPAVVEHVAAFGRDVLGKGVVVCRDTPYFIANRLGVYGLMAVFRAMERHGLDPATVDRITGPVMGRPRSATFRTLDLVGLDVFLDVLRNLAAALPAEAEAFRVPPLLQALVDRGRLGEKTGGGFYRREGGAVLVVDPETLEYRPRQPRSFPSLEAARTRGDPGERLRLLLDADDAAGRFAWEVSRDLWLYAAERLEEVAGGRVDAVDRAMRWGFGWELGPFQAWDAYGVERSLRRVEAEGRALPPVLAEFRSAGRAGWYEERQGDVWFWSPRLGLARQEEDPRGLTFAARKRAGGLVRGWPGASLVDLGEGVLGLELHSPKDALGPDALAALETAAELAPRGWRALVVGSDRADFGVGANLALILAAIQEEAWDEVDAAVRRFQRALRALKYLEVPVVAGVAGMVLGGAAELALAAHRVVAAADSYVGLVEVGVGLVPAGGGCTEMLQRALASLPPPPEGRSPLPPPDPQPAVARVFETLATARVSGSAVEARTLGFLGACDRIVANREHLLWAARREACRLAEDGWLPPAPPRIPVPGPDVRAALEWGAYYAHQAGRASEHDLRVARELAWVLCGGDLPAGTPVGEDYLLDLEREAFLRLCREPRTQERIVHLLQHGRPLRN